MYALREIYPQAPLALVAAEIRYPHSPRFKNSEFLDALQIDLEDRLPIRRAENRLTVQIVNGNIRQDENQVFRLTNKSSTTAMTLTPEILTVETTAYREFAEFQELVGYIVHIISARANVPLIERLGLRYIDEIRVPAKIDDVRDWGEWVTPDILRSIGLSKFGSRSFQSVVEYETGENTRMLVRAAALEGSGVVGNDPLKKLRPQDSGPYFVLDMDSFWNPPNLEESIEFSRGQVEAMLDSLHDPLGDVFQGALTDRARAVFRGEA